MMTEKLVGVRPAQWVVGGVEWVVADEEQAAVLVEEPRAPAPLCGPSRRTNTREYNAYVHTQMKARYAELVGALRAQGLDVW